MNRVIASVILSLFLFGCAEVSARAIQEAAYLARVADDYVKEQHETRQWIRGECKASLVRQVEDLKRTGDEIAVRALLSKYYPAPITIALITKIRNAPNSLLTNAEICESASGREQHD